MARGYSGMADVVKTTADGQDLKGLWDEFKASLDILNGKRTAIQNLLSLPTSLASELVIQSATGEDFEDASEYGVPTSMREPTDQLRMGFPFKWRDAATRYTWRYLAEASSDQVQALHAGALEADFRQVFAASLRALLTKTTIATRPVNESGTPIFALYDGETDSKPPAWNGQSFAPGHQHYLTSGSATIDGTDLRDLIRHVTHHGFTEQIVVLCNPTEAETIAGFRVATGAPFDFIPAVDAPAYLTNQTIVGERPAGTYEGLKVVGSYGDALIGSDFLLPPGYLTAVAAGAGVLAFREHANASLRGLQQIGGGSDKYPLIDSYYMRGFGVGVRKRGAAAVMQVTASATYTSPVISG